MPARKTLKDDWEQFSLGDYQVVNNTWNKGNLVNGEDYTQSVSFNPANLKKNVLLEWDWPDVGNVIAYPEIVVGRKPWDADSATKISSRIDNIDQFAVNIDYDISGDRKQFNVAFDLWLTDKARGGEQDITTELMIWTHEGEFSPAGAKVGTYRDGDFRAEIWVAENFGSGWRYVAIRAMDEVRKDTIDIARMLDKLADRGLIDEKDFVNGYEFGAEVTGGRGALDIHHLTHRFSTDDEAKSASVATSHGADDFLF